MQTQPKKQKGILFVFSNQLVYYADHLPQALSFPFKPEVIQHLDVINRELLITQIKTFIESHKLPPSLLSIIAHDSVLFEKLIPSQMLPQQIAHQTLQNPGADPSQLGVSEATLSENSTAATTQKEEIQKPAADKAHISALHLPRQEERKNRARLLEDQQSKIQQFIDAVPFEEEVTKTLDVPEGQLIIVGNKDLFLSIKEAFEVAGFSTDGIYPFVLFKGISISGGLTPQVCLELISKAETMKQQSMTLAIQSSEQESDAQSLDSTPHAMTDKKRLGIMIGVFAILVLFLILFYLKTDAENKKFMKKQAAPTAIPQVSPVPITSSPTIIPTVQPSLQAVTIQTVSIQIVSSTSSATLANQMRSVLSQAGYRNISLSQQSSPSQGRVFILFAPVVPLSLRESIITEARKVSATVGNQESTTISQNVVISL